MTVRTLLFTDVVDSTERVAGLGDEQAARLWATHDQQARRLLADTGGREIDRSDGFFLLFDAVPAALRFALAYHGLLAGMGLQARVGIHSGPVTLRDNTPADVARTTR
jgi:class 3 adenylate cyclase